MRVAAGAHVRWRWLLSCAVVVSAACASIARAEDEFRLPRSRPAASAQQAENPILTPEQWRRVDRTVDRGLEFLVRSQDANGAFNAPDRAQPAVTSLCVLALLARGHQPGKGPYGAALERAIDFVLTFPDPTTGALMWRGSSRSTEGHYNHAIAGVMLGEVYGMTTAERHDRIRDAIVRGLEYTRQQQLRPKRNPDEHGGWRYVHQFPPNDADLSITVWMLMFLRSAKNAEFDVPAEWIDDAMGYVRRSFDTREGGFVYALAGDERYCSRGMVGAGIVCMELGGEHRSPLAKEAGEWILRSSFERYNRSNYFEDRYHYSAFYCSQAMFQLGGEYWRKFFPPLLDVLEANQRPDGSWEPEAIKDGIVGNVYSSALTVLALAAPYQILPIYQR